MSFITHRVSFYNRVCRFITPCVAVPIWGVCCCWPYPGLPAWLFYPGPCRRFTSLFHSRMFLLTVVVSQDISRAERNICSSIPVHPQALNLRHPLLQHYSFRSTEMSWKWVSGTCLSSTTVIPLMNSVNSSSQHPSPSVRRIHSSTWMCWGHPHRNTWHASTKLQWGVERSWKIILDNDRGCTISPFKFLLVTT